MRYQGEEESVRLLRIDTPERGEDNYEAATEALRRHVGGRSVVLSFEEPGKVDRDRWGRLLAYVYVDGKNVNVAMVREGWSQFWTKYGEGRLAGEFRAAENLAEH